MSSQTSSGLRLRLDAPWPAARVRRVERAVGQSVIGAQSVRVAAVGGDGSVTLKIEGSLSAVELQERLAAVQVPGAMLVDMEMEAPDVVRALFLAADALEARTRQQRRQTALPRNAGKPWSHEEDERLLQAYDGGVTVDALTAAHERTRAGIEARLVKHGRLDTGQAPAARIR